jgi:hypothetical protein
MGFKGMASVHFPIHTMIRATDTLKSVRVYLEIFLLLVAAGIGITALDREEPFTMLPHDRITVKAGQYAAIDVPVRRDLSRHCDATLDRYLYDSSEHRSVLDTDAFLSDATIREQEALAPGRLKIRIPIPPIKSPEYRGGVNPGPARMMSEVSYSCSKGHRLWPITMRTEVLLYIVP